MLPEADKQEIELYAQASMLGVLHEVTKTGKIKKLETKVRQSGDKLPIGTTLDEFKK